MALPKKGSREIQVDGVSYRWLVRSRSTWNQQQASAYMSKSDSGKVRFVVELTNSPMSTLSVISRGWHKDIFRSWNIEITETEIASITPASVKKCVQHAISSGWDSHSSVDFELNLNNEICQL